MLLSMKKKYLFLILVIFTVSNASDAFAQIYNKSGNMPKPQVYKCKAGWSYEPCAPEPATPLPPTPRLTSEEKEYIEGKQEVKTYVSKEEQLQKVDLMLKSLEHRYHVIPNHAYQVRAMCRNPEISAATCQHLIDSLNADISDYSADQQIIELQRREERALDKTQKMKIRAELLDAMKKQYDNPRRRKRDIDRF